MRRTILLTIFILLAKVGNAGKINLDSLYLCLDNAIANSDKYVSRKNHHINVLKLKYYSTQSDMEKYDVGQQIYNEYHALMNDSAIAWLHRCIDVADKMNRVDLKNHSLIMIAHQFAASGFYSEAINYLSMVPQYAIKDSLAVEYYFTYSHLYGEMAFYANDWGMKQKYFKLSDQYRDMYFKIISHNSLLYISQRSMQLCNQRKYGEAMKYNNLWLTKVKRDTHDFAIVAFFRSEIYKNVHNVEMQKYWLTQSALYDIRCAVMDQSSLWSLADIVNRDGNVERSYNYIEFSWRCISAFSTHMRGWAVSPILTMISSNYREKVKMANTNLRYMIGTVSLLSLFLLFLLISVVRKGRQLRVARNELRDINSELASLNGQLKDANSELSTVNLRLCESNIVKDEYIGKFLSICSAYIDKIDNYRIRVNRKVKANQYKELLQMTSSQQLKEDELKELYDNFDSVFLHIFPNFVADFNALLLPEFQIALPDKNRLTTDIRIFALIRLGIDESSRIAEFLRYSPNSIYNYRARIKSRAICNRDDFEKRVKEISMEVKKES